MFRREFRREERRDVVEAAAVGGVVHETRKEHAEEAELAAMQAQQAQQPQQAAQAEPAAAGSTASAAAPPPATSALTDEQVNELERLAKLKQEGILSDDEFAAEKRKILGL